MNRNLGILALFICGVLAIGREGHAQTPDVDLYRCSSWTPIPWDKKGVRRRLFPFLIGQPDGPTQVAGFYVVKSKPHRGFFETSGQLSVSLISEPDGQNSTFWFVTLAGSEVLFVPDSDRWSMKVSNGRFTPLQLPADLRYIDCVKGDSPSALLEGTAEVGPLPPIADLFADKSKKTSESRAEPKKLGDVFVGDTNPPKSPGPIAGVIEAPLNEQRKPSESAPGAADEVANRGAETINSVCKAETLKPLMVPNGVTVNSLQPVGVRNNKVEATGYDYVSASGDAILLDINIDIADSASKLVPYDAVVTTRRNGADLLWVSLAGLDESRAKSKGAVASKPESILRVVIVGGASEVAISGLPQVGAEIRRQNRGRIRLSIEWYAVDASGSITRVGQYESLDKLVEAAAQKAAGRRPDVLNEVQLMNLFDGFESVLKARQQPVEKIFWIKGAYPIPSSIPQRFETFISRVSSSNIVGHTPTGRASKWLVLVTARMPGFSINYLKEPIYSQQIGDVIEEEDAATSGSRQLIRDVVLLATRLQIASVPIPAESPPSGINALTGKLVLNAKDIFDQRGYVLSPEAVTMLRDHLQRVSYLWNGTSLSEQDLLPWASKTGKSAPSTIDILQNADSRVYPRLPKSLPDWARKAVRDLNASELRDAHSFVEKYMNGANSAARQISRVSERKDDPGCGLFYVPEELFGFGRY